MVLCGARNRPLELTERAIVTGMGSNQNYRWSYDSLTKAFDEMAAFSARVFEKVGKRPHAHNEKVDWATFDCAECIEWQKRFDAAFKEDLTG